MACLDPELADRAADMACADNADFHLGTGSRLTQCRRRSEGSLKHERSRSAQYCAATAIDSDILAHVHTNSNCGTKSRRALPAQGRSPHREKYYNAKIVINSRPE